MKQRIFTCVAVAIALILGVELVNANVIRIPLGKLVKDKRELFLSSKYDPNKPVDLKPSYRIEGEESDDDGKRAAIVINDYQVSSLYATTAMHQHHLHLHLHLYMCNIRMQIAIDDHIVFLIHGFINDKKMMMKELKGIDIHISISSFALGV